MLIQQKIASDFATKAVSVAASVAKSVNFFLLSESQHEIMLTLQQRIEIAFAYGFENATAVKI